MTANHYAILQAAYASKVAGIGIDDIPEAQFPALITLYRRGLLSHTCDLSIRGGGRSVYRITIAGISALIVEHKYRRERI